MKDTLPPRTHQGQATSLLFKSLKGVKVIKIKCQNQSEMADATQRFVYDIERFLFENECLDIVKAHRTIR